MSRRPITPAEHELIEKILTADPATKDRYGAQLDGALVEVIDAYGSLRISPRGATTPKGPAMKLSTEGATNDLDGMRIELLLFARDGDLAELQIYRVDGSSLKRRAIAAGDVVVDVVR